MFGIIGAHVCCWCLMTKEQLWKEEDVKLVKTWMRFGVKLKAKLDAQDVLLPCFCA